VGKAPRQRVNVFAKQEKQKKQENLKVENLL
jgi:hypothetical protein